MKEEATQKKHRAPIKIEPGMMFGRLRVLYKCDYQYHSPSGHIANLWHCQCQCKDKNEIDVLTNSLTSGNTRSCGCLSKEHALNTLSKSGEKHRYQKGHGAKTNTKENYYILNEDFGIGYTAAGDKFFFDLEDYEKIKQIRWFTKISQGGNKYAVSDQQKCIYMHRFLMNLPSHKEDSRDVDHINHNTLDNRKENLRICEHYQNITSQKTRKDNKSGKKGVSWGEDRGKWLARITYNKHSYFLGRFDKYEDAVAAREKAEQQIHGEFNYIESQYSKEE